MARSRLLLARTLFSAVRSATRPGSASLATRAGALPRLVRAVRSGHYTGMTMTRLGLLAAALAYVVSPVDLLPEGALLMFGLVDDAMVLSWLAASLVNETESFLDWESGRGAQPTPGQPAYASGGYGPATGFGSFGYGPQDATVDGQIVR